MWSLNRAYRPRDTVQPTGGLVIQVSLGEWGVEYSKLIVAKQTPKFILDRAQGGRGVPADSASNHIYLARIVPPIPAE